MCAVLKHRLTLTVYTRASSGGSHTRLALTDRHSLLFGARFTVSPVATFSTVPTVSASAPLSILNSRSISGYIYTRTYARGSTRHARQQTALWKSDSVVNKLCTSRSLTTKAEPFWIGSRRKPDKRNWEYSQWSLFLQGYTQAYWSRPWVSGCV